MVVEEGVVSVVLLEEAAGSTPFFFVTRWIFVGEEDGDLDGVVWEEVTVVLAVAVAGGWTGFVFFFVPPSFFDTLVSLDVDDDVDDVDGGVTDEVAEMADFVTPTAAAGVLLPPSTFVVVGAACLFRADDDEACRSRVRTPAAGWFGPTIQYCGRDNKRRCIVPNTQRWRRVLCVCVLSLFSFVFAFSFFLFFLCGCLCLRFRLDFGLSFLFKRKNDWRPSQNTSTHKENKDERGRDRQTHSQGETKRRRNARHDSEVAGTSGRGH